MYVHLGFRNNIEILGYRLTIVFRIKTRILSSSLIVHRAGGNGCELVLCTYCTGWVLLNIRKSSKNYIGRDRTGLVFTKTFHN